MPIPMPPMPPIPPSMEGPFLSAFSTTRASVVNSMAAIDDPVIKAMRDKVHPAADPALAPDAAYVTVTTGSGKTLRADVAHCLGSATRPMVAAVATDDPVTAPNPAHPPIVAMASPPR